MLKLLVFFCFKNDNIIVFVILIIIQEAGFLFLNVSKKNIQHKLEADAKRVPHWGLRKLSVGVASVLLGTTIYFGAGSTVAHADTVESNGGNHIEQQGAVNEQLTGQTANLGQNHGENTEGKTDVAGSTSVAGQTDNHVNGSENQNAVAGNQQTAGNQQAAGSQQTTGDHQTDGDNGTSTLNVGSMDNVPVTPDIVASKAAANPTSDETLNKSVTRTINLYKPGTDAPEVKKDTIDFSRKLNDDGSYSDWTVKDGETAVFPKYDVPKIDGYTAYDKDGGNAVWEGEISPIHVTGNMSNFNINVAYRADTIYRQLKVVDQNGQVINTQNLQGVKGTVVNVDDDIIPVGYSLVDPSQTVPKSYTMDPNMNVPDIKVKENIIDVDGSHPHKYLDPIEGTNDLLHYPIGLEKEDLDRTIKRIITVKDSDGTVLKTIPQELHVKRTAHVHAYSGEVDYDSWTWDNNKSNFDAVDLGIKDGQTAFINGVVGTQVGAMQANPDLVDVAVDVKVVNDDEVVKVVYYLDGDATKTPLTEGSYLGKFSKDVDLNSVATKENLGLDTGYIVAPGALSKYTFTNDKNQVVYVPVTEAVVDVLHDQAAKPGEQIPNYADDSYPDGVDDNDLNQTITRTIVVTPPAGHGEAKTITQTAKISRDAKVHVVSGQVDYGDWSTDAKNWTDFKPAAIDGFTVSQSDVPAVEVNDGQKNQTINITYTANDQTMNVIFQDGNGNEIARTTVSGKTDQTKATNAQLPTGWVLSQGQSIPESVTFTGAHTDDVIVKIQHGLKAYTSDKPVAPDEKTLTGKAINGGHASDLNQTITRTINITKPHEQTKTTTQTAKITRGATVDEVTGEVTYDPWTTDAKSWTDVKPDSVDGYTVNITDVPAVEVRDGQKNETVDITYTANDQSMKIIYQDAGGATVDSTTVTGKTDQTVDTNSVVPAGWVLTDGESTPATITFKGAHTADVVLKVVHGSRDVTPDKPVKSDEKTPSGKVINGAHESDLNKTITRTVTVTKPGQEEVTIASQPVHLTRTAKVDTVTGEVTYGDWTTGSWDTVAVPVVAGYTPNISSIDVTPVTYETQDSNLHITYTANAQSMRIHFVDVSGKDVVDPVMVSGKTDEVKHLGTDYQANVPTGWVLTQGATPVPTEITFGPDGHEDVNVLIEHGVKSISHDNPIPDGQKTSTGKLINGGHESDLNRTLTRTITITNPDGTTKKIPQVAHIHRDASYDDVTGEVTPGIWSTDTWAKYKVPVIDGYTASQTSVEELVVDGDTEDTPVNITYTANDQQMTITFYDQDGNKVTDKVIKGTTNSTTPVGDLIPDGWELYDGQNVPKDITFKAHNDNQDFVIKHVLSLVSADNIPVAGSVIKGTKAKTYPEGLTSDMLTKTITRTIQVMKDGHQVGTKTQTVTFLRNAVVDAVTGSVKTLAWSEGGSHVFTAYQPASIEGYTVDGAKAMTVSPLSDPSTTVVVNYKAVPQALNVIYQTADGQQVGSTVSMVADKEGQIDLTSQLPSGYELSTPVQKTSVSDLHVNNYYVTVKPRLKVYTSEDADIPSGVHLTKAVNRTINITLPNGKHKTINQMVNFNRMVTIDANGNSTYTDWKAVGTDTFDGVRLPVRHGYKLVFDDGSNGIKAQQVTNAETANDVVINVSYVKAQKLYVVIQKDVSMVEASFFLCMR